MDSKCTTYADEFHQRNQTRTILAGIVLTKISTVAKVTTKIGIFFRWGQSFLLISICKFRIYQVHHLVGSTWIPYETYSRLEQDAIVAATHHACNVLSERALLENCLLVVPHLEVQERYAKDVDVKLERRTADT